MPSAAPLLMALIAQSASPGLQCGHTMLYSSLKKAVLLIGGETEAGNKIWARNSSGWNRLNSLGKHRAYSAVALGFEPETIVMQGGAIPVSTPTGRKDMRVVGETWSWDGTTWSHVASGGPGARGNHAMAYDQSRNRIVLFGGVDAGGALYGDTWEWDGRIWAKVAETGPFPRSHHAMAYDPVRKQVVMVGGRGINAKVDPQTWIWNGREWSAVSAGAPALRGAPRMTFDGRLGKILLFGGETLATFPEDTWTWEGTTWTAIDKVGPPGRISHGLAYDPDRKVTVLQGGATPDLLGDLWEFGEAGWKKIRQ